jgi:hypothetical protein
MNRGTINKDARCKNKKESHMKFKMPYSMVATATLPALMPFAEAQGPAGATGAVASIPGSTCHSARYQCYHQFDSA